MDASPWYTHLNTRTHTQQQHTYTHTCLRIVSELTSNWMTFSTSRPPVWRLRTFFAMPLVPLPITPKSSRSSRVSSLVLGLPVPCWVLCVFVFNGSVACDAE